MQGHPPRSWKCLGRIGVSCERVEVLPLGSKRVEARRITLKCFFFLTDLTGFGSRVLGTGVNLYVTQITANRPLIPWQGSAPRSVSNNRFTQPR